VSRRKKIALTALAVVVTFGAVSLLLWGFVRDAIVLPIHDFMLTVGDLANTIPQAIYLTALTLACVAIALNTLFGFEPTRTRWGLHEETAAETRYRRWARFHGALTSGLVARREFALETRQLVLAILSHQEGLDPRAVEIGIIDGSIEVPSEVKRLIQQSDISPSTPPQRAAAGVLSRLHRWLSETDQLRDDTRTDQQVQRLVEYIEHRLEIHHAGT